MGIKQVHAPALRVRQPAVEDLTEFAGSRAPPKTPQRQRGLWSFLTWPFVIAPIVAAESFVLANRHALASEDQDDRAADHSQGRLDATPDHDQASAGAPHVAPDNPGDQADAQQRNFDGVPKVHHADLPQDEHVKPPIAHQPPAAVQDSPPADGGGGGGSSASASSVDTGSATAGGDSFPVDASPSGDSSLTHMATDVVSTLVGSVSDVLAPVGLGGLIGSIDLKDVLGFDLQVNPAGQFVATDLGAILDHTPLLPLAGTVVDVVSPVTDGLPVLGELGTSNVLDSLFGADHSSAIGLPGDLSSILGNVGSTDPIPTLAGIVSGDGIASVDKLADALLATSPIGGTHALLPMIAAAPDPAQVSIIGEATSVTPGHSIDFPAPVSAEGDVLFHGNSYTDYHVALQSTGPSAVSSSITSALTDVASTISGAGSLAHVDTPAPNPPAASSVASAPPHPDASLAHVASTLDDLSLRTHTH